jgi:serine/threonine-protein phosphatase 2A regulatory subunit B
VATASKLKVAFNAFGLKTEINHILLHSQVLTGSYHNYFRIYDVNESGDKDAVLQADKSAFKAKKIGGPKGQGKGPNGTGKKEGLQTENIDFAKKIVR